MAVILMGLLMNGPPSSAGLQEQSVSFVVNPVGKIHKQGNETTLEIESKYQDAILGLEGLSHAWAIW
jgi:tRNA (Thr-GGU) A37 N-methylase